MSQKVKIVLVLTVLLIATLACSIWAKPIEPDKSQFDAPKTEILNYPGYIVIASSENLKPENNSKVEFLAINTSDFIFWTDVILPKYKVRYFSCINAQSATFTLEGKPDKDLLLQVCGGTPISFIFIIDNRPIGNSGDA